MPCRALGTRGFPALRRHQSFPTSLIPPHRRSGTSTKGIREVPLLSSWSSAVFEHAYRQRLPARLPRSRAHLPAACAKWFVHDDDLGFDLFSGDDGRMINVPRSSELRASFWSEHESTFVPLEITTTRGASTSPSFYHLAGERASSAPGQSEERFERIEAPLKILIAYLSKPTTTGTTADSSPLAKEDVSIYLAQCDLLSLPASMQSDVPIPALLHPSSTSSSRSAIKGDIYTSSLWLGRPPTYTPLHRDPNPNLFIQLAGQKTIRLLPPDIGDALFHDVVTTTTSSPTMSPSGPTPFSTTIRGEEMMYGPQKAALHDAVWNPSSIYSDLVRTHGLQTTLGLGDALFTPQGWWHSVKGVGEGVTASVNWWFR
ncbi:uncharacterized protein Z519_03996 [Cladophialophora bantiana CBS 173.52]|uniref:JmjC domain-containing protein n=1 Tax=Cladophialophora bantiana (strain ATCC 10958 / CBS 173.52 / CDC B-1940 / NIH 8579) TaxID=1442370 RepID=A0A0D2G9Z5_CLAB1|nr:uncharacterized protein Z519_03996 [Cladophialophora bantiana CBS 173.52]KIW95412.1 hypothetical protein Z519_03996 [Cladophialophora bantiana CBS 173.52]